MEFDEPKGQFPFSCEHCGHTFYAAPPDHDFTHATVKQCFICDVLSLGKYVERKYECDNCHKMTKMYWHVPTTHTPFEKAKANSESLNYLMRRK
jgi:hypothetical protein